MTDLSEIKKLLREQRETEEEARKELLAELRRDRDDRDAEPTPEERLRRFHTENDPDAILADRKARRTGGAA